MAEALVASGIVFIIGAVVFYFAARYFHWSCDRDLERFKRETQADIEAYRQKCEETLGQYRRLR